MRRLQISYHGARREESQIDDDELTSKLKDDLKFLQRIRQDLERARLLIELLRKREKLKKEQIRNHEMIVECHLQPFRLFVNKLIENLIAKDTNEFFTDPVDIEEVPDYFEFIKKPMDFMAMKKKNDRNEYSNLDQVRADFELLISNCKSYNEPDTIYHKAASQMKQRCASVFSEAESKYAKGGFDRVSGLHDPPTSMAEHRTDSLNAARDEEKKLRERLTELSNELERVRKCKSGGSRSKKIKELSAQITAIQREIGALNPTMFPDMDMDEMQAVMSLPLLAAVPHLPPPSVPPTVKKEKPSPQKTPKKRARVESSDSDETDTYSIPTLTPIKLPTEGGRRTMNSVSAAIEDSLIGPLKKTPPNNGTSENDNNNSSITSKCAIM